MDKDEQVKTGRRDVLKDFSMAGVAMAVGLGAASAGADPVATVPDHAPDREKAGLAIIEQLGWGQNEGVRAIDADLWRIVSEANFGTIWTRPGLSLRDREMICIAILVAIGAQGVALHFKHASKAGISDAELKEIILQAIPYAGLPKALSAMALLRHIQQGGEAKL
jgi:4-carboxymuconolactone decarboxylase